MADLLRSRLVGGRSGAAGACGGNSGGRSCCAAAPAASEVPPALENPPRLLVVAFLGDFEFAIGFGDEEEEAKEQDKAEGSSSMSELRTVGEDFMTAVADNGSDRLNSLKFRLKRGLFDGV